MMARSTSLQSKAGYIDARPLTTNPSKSSCYARPDHTFGSRVDGALARTFLRRCSIGRVRLRVRPVCAARMAAGPNALRGSGPNPSHAFEDALTQAGSPDPRNDRICITSSCPRQIRCSFLPVVDTYAAAGSNFDSLNRSPRTIMAHAMRAILLASATAATLVGRRPIRRASQSRFVPCCRAYRMTAIAPATSSHRKCRLPLL